jgi:hypothetical protein
MHVLNMNECLKRAFRRDYFVELTIRPFRDVNSRRILVFMSLQMSSKSDTTYTKLRISLQ